MSKETTLVLLKPDCVAQKHCGEVLGRFEKAGYTIRGLKMLRMDDDLLRAHYWQHVNEPYFPPLADFMRSGPVVAVALSGENVIADVRQMLGPTDSAKAPKGTIRGDLGTNNRVNVVHASDSPETAEAEVPRFFKADELVQ